MIGAGDEHQRGAGANAESSERIPFCMDPRHGVTSSQMDSGLKPHRRRRNTQAPTWPHPTTAWSQPIRVQISGQRRVPAESRSRRGKGVPSAMQPTTCHQPRPCRQPMMTCHVSPVLLAPLLICLLLSAPHQCQAGLHQARNRQALGDSVNGRRSHTEGTAFGRLLSGFHATWRQTTWYQSTLQQDVAKQRQNEQEQQQQQQQPPQHQGPLAGDELGKVQGVAVGRSEQVASTVRSHGPWRQTTWYKATLQQADAQQQTQDQNQAQQQQGSLAGDEQGKVQAVGRSEQPSSTVQSHGPWHLTTWYRSTLQQKGAQQQRDGALQRQAAGRSAQVGAAVSRHLSAFHATWRQTTWYQTTLQQDGPQQQLQQQGSLAGDEGGNGGQLAVGRSEQVGTSDGGAQIPQHTPTGGSPHHIQSFTRGSLDRGRVRGLVRPHAGHSLGVGKATGTPQGGGQEQAEGGGGGSTREGPTRGVPEGEGSSGEVGSGRLGKASLATGRPRYTTGAGKQVAGGRGAVATRTPGQGAAVRPYGVKARPDSRRRVSPHPPRGKLPYALRRRPQKLPGKLPQPKVTRPNTLATPGPGTPGVLPQAAPTLAGVAVLTLEQSKVAKIGDFDPALAFNCTVWVTKGGDNGAFTSVQAAIDSLDPMRGPATVCVGPGTYIERVTVHEGLDNLTLAGSGAGTIITSETGALSAGGPFLAATMTVYGNFFRGAHFILENTLFTVTDPCPAVTTSGNRSTWQSVGFISWVDTVALRYGHHLFQNCLVSGLTDIIWGFGRGAFVDSIVWARNFPSATTLFTGFIAVFGTDKASEGIVSGCVFHRCAVLGDGPMCLGRPYRSQQHVVYSDCYLGKNVCPDGWGDYNGYLAFHTFDLREFRSYGPGANPTGRKWGNVSADPPPEVFSVPNFLIGVD